MYIAFLVRVYLYLIMQQKTTPIFCYKPVSLELIEGFNFPLKLQFCTAQHYIISSVSNKWTTTIPNAVLFYLF